MYIIRIETPLLWVEYDETDESLNEGDVISVQPTQDLFQVGDIIPLTGGGAILALQAPSKAKWPKVGDRVNYIKVRRQG